MDLFDRASKLFHYESPSLFITSLEKHIVPYLVSSEHTDIHQVSCPPTQSPYAVPKYRHCVNIQYTPCNVQLFYVFIVFLY